MRGVGRWAALALVLGVAGCASAPREERVATDASLRAPGLDGRAVDVDGALARGETVALIVWQTWCRACEREAPAVVAAYARHGDAIRFVGVVPGKDADVDPAEVEARRSAWGYAFPHVRDRDLAWCRALSVDGTPTIVVLGPGRVVRYRGRHVPADWAALRGPLLARDPAPAPGGSSASGAPSEDCEGGVCPLPGSDAAHPGP